MGVLENAEEIIRHTLIFVFVQVFSPDNFYLEPADYFSCQAHAIGAGGLGFDSR